MLPASRTRARAVFFVADEEIAIAFLKLVESDRPFNSYLGGTLSKKVTD
ncbi:hypothetical protein [Okeania sp. KiyG1]|nr:hypothetical protein [Okeania sp. KiyG1]